MCDRELRARVSKQPHPRHCYCCPLESAGKWQAQWCRRGRTFPSRFGVFLEGLPWEMSPVEQEGFYTSRWGPGMQLYHPEGLNASATNIWVPQFPQLEKAGCRVRIRVIESCPSGLQSCGRNCVLLRLCSLFCPLQTLPILTLSPTSSTMPCIQALMKC